MLANVEANPNYAQLAAARRQKLSVNQSDGAHLPISGAATPTSSAKTFTYSDFTVQQLVSETLLEHKRPPAVIVVMSTTSYSPN